MLPAMILIDWGGPESYFNLHMDAAQIRSQALVIALVATAVAIVPGDARAQKESQEAAAFVPQAPFAVLSASALELRDSLVAHARAQLGKRYRRGGETPKRGFDCSGLVAYVLMGLNLSVPRTAAEQAKVGSEIVKDTAQLLPGDLLTFGKGKKVTHIGIYIGNGRFIQASSRAGRVIETNLLRAPAPGIRPWQGVRRLVPADSAALSLSLPLQPSASTTIE
jgi:cell wall-associated NlpC family hydrolase